MNAKHPRLTLPDPDSPVSYLIASLEKGTFGTGQIQSAKMVVRYPDTAYKANGNYGVQYNVELPLYNNAASDRTVTVRLESPLKNDTTKESLTFIEPQSDKVFFRGTVMACYIDDSGAEQRCFYHLVLKQGDHGAPLLKLKMKPREFRSVKVSFLYPPDATPPQVLTVESAI
jgi:hypothetical protein